MRERLLPYWLAAKQYVINEYIQLKEFYHNPANFPPLMQTLITVVVIAAFFIIVYSLWSFLRSKKRVPSWGIVYDSVTKRPLDPALVELRDNVGKRVGSAITDMDGRYGFSSQVSGMYIMSAKKSNYAFPSKTLAGKTHDGSYANLYFGEDLFISKDENVITRNIPLDPMSFDWNENEKKEQNLLHSYSRFRIFIKYCIRWYFIALFIITIAASFFLPAPYRYIVYAPIAVFIIINCFKAVLISTRGYGIVIEKKSGLRMPNALIHIYYAIPSLEPIKYATKKCDLEGKYYCLLPNGQYYVIIEKWNPEQKKLALYTPKLVYTSEPFTVSNGVLNKTFEV
jgi:hypothetical protein